MYIKIISPASLECLTTTICSRQQEHPISKGRPRQLLDQQQSTIVESPASDQHTYQEQEKDTREVDSYDICNSDEKPEPKNSHVVNKVRNGSKRKIDSGNYAEQEQSNQSHKVKKRKKNKPFVKLICMPKAHQQLSNHLNTQPENCVERLSDCINDYRIEISEGKKKLRSLNRTLARLEKAHAEIKISQNQEQTYVSDEGKDNEGDDQEEEEENHLNQARTVELYQLLIKYAQKQLFVIKSL